MLILRTGRWCNGGGSQQADLQGCSPPGRAHCDLRVSMVYNWALAAAGALPPSTAPAAAAGGPACRRQACIRTAPPLACLLQQEEAPSGSSQPKMIQSATEPEAQLGSGQAAPQPTM